MRIKRTQGKKVQGQETSGRALPLAECTQCILRMVNAFTLDCYFVLLKGQYALLTLKHSMENCTQPVEKPADFMAYWRITITGNKQRRKLPPL